MALLNKDMIEYLAKLSRINCSKKEQEDLLLDLEKILSYAEQLQEIDTQNVPPCNHVLENMTNVTREDIVGETMPRELLLENAPSQVAGLIRIPTFMKQ